MAEGGVAEEGVTLSSIKPDAALVPHQAAALAGTQLPSLAPQSLATPSITTQSLAAPLNSMVRESSLLFVSVCTCIVRTVTLLMAFF